MSPSAALATPLQKDRRWSSTIRRQHHGVDVPSQSHAGPSHCFMQIIAVRAADDQQFYIYWGLPSLASTAAITLGRKQGNRRSRFPHSTSSRQSRATNTGKLPAYAGLLTVLPGNSTRPSQGEEKPLDTSGSPPCDSTKPLRTETQWPAARLRRAQRRTRQPGRDVRDAAVGKQVADLGDCQRRDQFSRRTPRSGDGRGQRSTTRRRAAPYRTRSR
jgi:hypothetical protein